MTPAEIYIDLFERILENGEAVVDGLTEEQLAHRPAPDANSVAWLVWHLTRVQDSHVAPLAGTEEVWTRDGWADRFGLELDLSDHGYGHTSEQVAKVRASAELLAGYCAPRTGRRWRTCAPSPRPTSTTSSTRAGTRR